MLQGRLALPRASSAAAFRLELNSFRIGLIPEPARVRGVVMAASWEFGHAIVRDIMLPRMMGRSGRQI
jgi:hypothetical protein